MKTKKKIDRLFREQFKDFEVTPPPAVWDSISNSLQQEKKKRRIIPIWYKVAGVAALIAVFFTVGNLLFDSSTTEITNDTDVITQPSPDVVPQPTQTIVSSTSETEADKEDVLLETETTLTTTTEQRSQKEPSESRVNVIASSGKNKSIRETSDKNKIISSEKTKEEIAETPATVVEAKVDVLPAEKSSEAIAVSEENNNKKSLLDAIKEKEDAKNIPETKKTERWDIAPNFAPVYYGALGSGSSIDPQFSNSPKTGDVNYSYGVQVSYNINDKLSVRTGVNKVDLSYTTNDIEFTAIASHGGMQSINYSNNDFIITMGNRGTLQNDPSNGEISPRSGIVSGSFNQQLGYFEIPMELKYTIINSRFGINMIGGMSTLLLENNEISVRSDGFETTIGEANNLNDVSFTTNVGLGLNYKFTRRFVFNLEPMFKYQINPYSDKSIDYKPYYFGVYSGMSFRF